MNAPQQACAWVRFYRKFFSLEVDVSALRIPPSREGFDRLIVVAQKLTFARVYVVCEQLFACSNEEDIDPLVLECVNDRDPQSGVYAVWVRDNIVPSQEPFGLSADELRAQGISSTTVIEEMLCRLSYHQQTRRSPHAREGLICGGSRFADPDRDVPLIREFPGFHIDWCPSGMSGWGIREVVA
jgi:hypothetical protein